MDFLNVPGPEEFEIFSDNANLQLQETQQQNDTPHQDFILYDFVQNALDKESASSDQLQPEGMEENVQNAEPLHAQMDIAFHEFPYVEELRTALEASSLQEDVNNQIQSQVQLSQSGFQVPDVMENHAYKPIHTDSVNEPLCSQSFGPCNIQTVDMECDEIQPNIPIEKHKEKSTRRYSHSTDIHPSKRRRLDKKSIIRKHNDCEIGSKYTTTPARFDLASDVKGFDGMRAGAVEGNVKCRQCDDLFANPEAMDRHFRMVHLKTNTKTYPCQECGRACRSITNLRRHWNNAHTGVLDFTCDGCGARFATKRSLSLHKVQEHPDTCKQRRKRNKAKIHNCKMCDYTSYQSYNVTRHFFTMHTDAVAMECPHGCGRTFKSKSNAKVHFFKCKQNRPAIEE